MWFTYPSNWYIDSLFRAAFATVDVIFNNEAPLYIVSGVNVINMESTVVDIVAPSLSTVVVVFASVGDVKKLLPPLCDDNDDSNLFKSELVKIRAPNAFMITGLVLMSSAILSCAQFTLLGCSFSCPYSGMARGSGEESEYSGSR